LSPGAGRVAAGAVRSDSRTDATEPEPEVRSYLGFGCPSTKRRIPSAAFRRARVVQLPLRPRPPHLASARKAGSHWDGTRTSVVRMRCDVLRIEAANVILPMQSAFRAVPSQNVLLTQ
jgi:hypothetical protein